MKKTHQPRYSNYEYFYAGQMGTTAGKIVARKRFKWERIKIGNNPVSLPANTTPQKNRIKQIHPKNELRNNGDLNTVLYKIVEEYNKHHTCNYLMQYLKDKKESEFKLLKDCIYHKTNAILHRIPYNGEYKIFTKNNKEHKIKIAK